MKKALVGGLMAALIAAGVAGWVLRWRGHQPRETAAQLQHQIFLETTLSGHSGKLATDSWAAYAPCYREGALQVHAALVGPGLRGEGQSPRSPRFLLLYRLAPAVPYVMAGIMSRTGLQGGNKLDISLDQYAADGQLFKFKWEGVVKNPERPALPHSGQVQERVQAGGKDYEMKAGRVFFVDLTTTPPAVVQKEGDLAELFRGADETITTEELKGIVERLSSLEPPVKAFLAQIPMKP